MSKGMGKNDFFKLFRWPPFVSGRRFERLQTVCERSKIELNNARQRNSDLVQANTRLSEEISCIESDLLQREKQITQTENILSEYEEIGKKFGISLSEELQYHRRLSNAASIVQDHSLGISPEIQKRFKDDVEQINQHEEAKSESASPIRFDAQQERMIFSNSPATNVLAGAGSGKSTTLVLRVIL